MYFTEKQLRIMEFIQQFRDERGISPTLEEIASNFGVTKITVYEHINQLERKGALKRERRPRGGAPSACGVAREDHSHSMVPGGFEVTS